VNIDGTQPAAPERPLLYEVQDLVVVDGWKLVQVGEQIEHDIALPD